MRRTEAAPEIGQESVTRWVDDLRKVTYPQSNSSSSEPTKNKQERVTAPLSKPGTASRTSIQAPHLPDLLSHPLFHWLQPHITLSRRENKPSGSLRQSLCTYQVLLCYENGQGIQPKSPPHLPGGLANFLLARVSSITFIHFVAFGEFSGRDRPHARATRTRPIY